MKAKIVRDWKGRRKDMNELHADAQQWLSEIEFIKDEIRFLEYLMSSNYIELLGKRDSKSIKVYSTSLKERNKTASKVMKCILKHEKILNNLIQAKSVEANTHFLEQHKEIEKLLYQFHKNYKKLKQSIFSVVEEVRRNKKQKKIS